MSGLSLTNDTSMLFLSKLLPIFFYPLGSVIGMAGFGLFFAAMAWRRLSIICVGIATLWLWIASMPAFADWALGTLEGQYPPIPVDAIQSADVAIILGGAVGQPSPPRHTIELVEASDRVWFASRLYRAGKVKRILVSGGNIPWRPTSRPEAELIRSLLVEWGVSDSAIEVATRSQNTYENAQEISEIQERAPFRSALLVTSAAHMPRAMAVFTKAGLPVIAATADLRVVSVGKGTVMRWLPQVDALSRTTDAIKEWIGYMAYRQLGYL